MKKLYPFKFNPILMYRIWGGTKLTTMYSKQLPDGMDLCGESWELSGVQGNISVVSNGFLAGNNLQELIEVYMDELVGGKVYAKFGLEFPLLIKLIDASDVLSIQVHPDDVLAAERHHAFGKTEMWYILDSEDDSKIITGFDRTLTKEEYVDLLNSGKLPEVLKYEEAKPGDFFFIPAGKVHAIGKGIVLAEIQQTSDITYRIYDWDRVDSNGKSRELHTDLAVDAIDLNKAEDTKRSLPAEPNNSQELVGCPYFITNRIAISEPLGVECYTRDSFTIYQCIEGSLSIVYGDDLAIDVAKGELVLVPAGISSIKLEPKPEATLLEVYIP